MSRFSGWTSEAVKALNGERLEKKNTPQRKATTNPRKAALKACDREFSLLMRATEADEFGMCTCCTCGNRYKWKDPQRRMHWGHWQGRGKNSVRWNPLNGGPQCWKCNKYEEGKKQDMEKYLIDRYGEIEIRLIEAKANLSVKYSEFELRQMTRQFKQEANKIIKNKGI